MKDIIGTATAAAAAALAFAFAPAPLSAAPVEAPQPPPEWEWSGASHAGKKEIAIRGIPQWVKEGKKSPTGRHTFTTWKHWSKEDDLLPSGLLGPVILRFGEPAR